VIALSWLAVALAEPLGPGSPEFDRLLGEEAAPLEAPAALPPAPALSPWPLALGVAGLLALWWGRGRLELPIASEPELRVVGRTALGGRAGLAVIEVRAPDGGWRRLVVGTGDGAPRLVADLGASSFDEVLDEVAPPAAAPPAAEPPAAEPPAAEPTAADLVQEVLGERTRRVRSSVSTIA
jgi:hypothetical protein